MRTATTTAPVEQVTVTIPRSDLPAGYDTSATCPVETCQAVPGQDCKTPTGRPTRNGTHKERTARIAELSARAAVRSASRRVKTGQG